MKFGREPAIQAAGAILAHGVRVGATLFKKGRLLDEADARALVAGWIDSVMVARLEANDVGEDVAARTIAAAAMGAGITAGRAFTGRVNLFAAMRGLVRVDAAAVDAVNSLDEAITIATLRPLELVEAKQMVGTIKIIPFAAPRAAVTEAVRQASRLIAIAPFAARAAGLIQTRLPETKSSVLDKTRDVMRARLERIDSSLAAELRCAHDIAALTDAIAQLRARNCDPILVVGASAITDRRDVIPAAITGAGGTVERFGMPVDPGNLLLLAKGADGVPIIGLPGCARSPKLNGIDWVLERLVAGVPATDRDIQRMGAGGLLTEIPTRPQPRIESGTNGSPRRIAAVVLAAGRSTRMGGPNKLLAALSGTPMVARVVDAVLASAARPVIVVIGHEKDKVRAALAGRDVTFVDNPDYAEGLSTSLHRGLAALPSAIDGFLVALGDMPGVGAADIERLMAAFDPVEGRAICVPTHQGKRGNPVLWARRFIPEMMEVSGDVGARHLIGAHADAVTDIEMERDSVLVDIDTPEALARASGA